MKLIGGTNNLPINEIIIARLGATELNIVVTGQILARVLLFFSEGIVGSLCIRNRLLSLLDWELI